MTTTPDLLGDALAAYRSAGETAPESMRALARLDAADALADVVELLVDLDAYNGRRCARCGCTDAEACDGGCTWARLDPPICSECIDTVEAPGAGILLPAELTGLLDAIVAELDPPAATNIAGGMTPTAELDEARELLTLLDDLTRYAGPALTAPLAQAAAGLIAQATAYRDAQRHATNDALDALDGRAKRGALLRSAGAAIADLGAELGRARITLDATRDNVDLLDLFVEELTAAIARIPEPKPGHPATKPLTHPQATALVREARKRAATRHADAKANDLDDESA